MEFVVLILYVLAITFTLVIARPQDMEHHTKNGKYTEEHSYEQFKFMLPVAANNLTDNYEIEINGIFNLSHENFAALLLSGVEESTSCTLNFNYEKNSDLVMSSELENTKISAKFSRGNTPEFRLILKPKYIDDKDENIIIFQLDLSPPVACKVNSLDNLSHIIFKEGVKKIHSIQFTFLERQ